MKKRKRVGGDPFSPSLSSLSLLCLNLSSHVFSALGFPPCAVSYFLLTDNSGSRVPLNGSNQLASRVPKEMVKGKRPNKESSSVPPKESPSVQQSADGTGGVQVMPPKKKKEEKLSSAHGALPATPSHPPPIKPALPSGGTSLTLLQRSPHKAKKMSCRIRI